MAYRVDFTDDQFTQVCMALQERQRKLERQLLNLERIREMAQDCTVALGNVEKSQWVNPSVLKSVG